MKQFSLLLATAVFFTAAGFLWGQQSQQEPAATLKNQLTTSQPDKNNINIKNPAVQHKVTQPTATVTPITATQEKCMPASNREGKGFINEADLNQITTLLNKLPTKKERADALNALFENNQRTPEVDSDSAVEISDFFHREKNLEAFIPQQISCHSNLCQVDLPAVDASDINHLMETLSSQLNEQKLKASHILLADDASHGSTKLYVSLLPDESQGSTEQQ